MCVGGAAASRPGPCFSSYACAGTSRRGTLSPSTRGCLNLPPENTRPCCHQAVHPCFLLHVSLTCISFHKPHRCTGCLYVMCKTRLGKGGRRGLGVTETPVWGPHWGHDGLAHIELLPLALSLTSASILWAQVQARAVPRVDLAAVALPPRVQPAAALRWRS